MFFFLSNRYEGYVLCSYRSIDPLSPFFLYSVDICGHNDPQEVLLLLKETNGSLLYRAPIRSEEGDEELINLTPAPGFVLLIGS